MTKTKYPPIILVMAFILMFAFSCECPAQIEPGPEVKPTKPPIAKPTPTPATLESWTEKIEESATAQKFITKKSVIKAGDVAQYPTERIVQDPSSKSAVKGVRWVKTYRLWMRGDGVVIPLSNGWTAETILDTLTSVVDKPKVEVFK